MKPHFLLCIPINYTNLKTIREVIHQLSRGKRCVLAGGVLLLFFIIIGVMLWKYQGISEISPLKPALRDVIVNRLHPDDRSVYTPESDHSNGYQSILYVLGGTQCSLVHKFRAASHLYHAGASEKIMVLHSPGVTAFDAALQRNLTNDEWAVKQLTGLGVHQYDIEFIHVKDGYFGTLTEAKTVRDLLEIRDVQRLVLVCSSYHGRRVQNTFSTLLTGSDLDIMICPAEEEVGLGGLLIEYGKVVLYEMILLPWEVRFGDRRAGPAALEDKHGCIGYMFSNQNLQVEG